MSNLPNTGALTWQGSSDYLIIKFPYNGQNNLDLPKLTLLLQIILRGGAVVARWAHNPKVAGSSPVPATKKPPEFFFRGFLFIISLSICYYCILKKQATLLR